VRAWFKGTGPTSCLFLFGLAVSARLAYLFQFRPSLDSAYWSISDHLARTGTLTIAGGAITDYEPLYLVFLAAARTLAGGRVILVQILQIAVAALGAVFLYRLSLALTASKRAATIAGILFAVHPLLVRQAAAASDLSLATTLLVAFAHAFVSMRGVVGAAMAGICIGLAVLTRSMTLPVLAGGVAVLIAARKTVLLAPFLAAAALLIAPFVLWNYLESGSWWPTRSGVNLYIGNSPYSAALLPDYDLDLLEPVAYQITSALRPDLTPDTAGYAQRIDAYLTSAAIDHMRARPMATLREKLKNILYVFSPRLVPFYVSGPDTRVIIADGRVVRVEQSLTRPRVEVVAHALASSLLLFGSAVGVYVRRRALRQDAILWAVLATFVAVNVIYVPATRYGAPMQFVLMFYSAVALARLKGFR
jgi:hypothetical protein